MKWFTLVLRVAMEVGVVVGLAWWGWQSGGSTAAKIALGLGAPIVGFGLWGAVDFRRAGRVAEPLRLVEELVISLMAAAALVAVGQRVWGWALALLSIVYHVLVYATGDTLLRQERARAEADPR